MSVLHKKMV